jgi:predicted secreted protein
MKMLPLFAALLLPATALAADDDLLNRVEFQVQSEREVDNDLARAVLVVDLENTDAAQLADDVNEDMAWALEQSRTQKAVRVRSGSYRTYPVYDQQRVARWRAEQELTLESGDAKALNGLVGRLQDRLQVRSMAFTVSEARRRETETALTGTALDDFRRRAEAIAQRLGAKGYDIVQLQIQSGGDQPSPPSPFLSRAMAVPAESAVASEPGSSHLEVGVRAAIRLRF